MGTLASLALVAALTGACGDKKGAIMLAISTDMKAPKDVNAVSVTISSNGQVIHSAIGRVTPQGEILLPATLAIAEGDDPTRAIRIRVMAFQNNRARVLRDVRTSIPKGGRVALLRVPMNFASDESARGNPLPSGVLPDPIPGTGGTTSGQTDGGGSAEGGTTSGGSSGTASAGEFDFFNEYQPTCDDPVTQTVIDGVCQDNAIDPETLPDFDPALVGDSTDPSSCFDVTKCLGSATPISESSGDVAADAGTAGKNIGTLAVTLNRQTCSLSLNGASAARLNLALVTPDAGECVRPGECYVPIDRGAGGWREEDGAVKLPAFVCTLLAKKNLRLAQTVDVCAAKEESNPICAERASGPIDGGPGSLVTLVTKADFATSVVSLGTPTSPLLNTLLLAGADGARTIDLKNAEPTPIAIKGIAAGSKVPWRVGTGTGLPSVANGTTQAFVFSNLQGAPQGTIATIAVSVPANTVQGVPIGGGTAWAVDADGAAISYTQSNGTTSQPVSLTSAPPNATAVAEFPNWGLAVGDRVGALRLCSVSGASGTCGFPKTLGTTRVDAVIATPGSAGTNGYVLLQDALVEVRVDTFGVSTIRTIPTQTLGVADGGQYFPRSLATGVRCVYFTSARGLEYVSYPAVGTFAGVLVPASSHPILGVATEVAPGQGTGGVKAVYFTVFAPSASGGGLFRVAEPPPCTSSSSADGGVDSGTDSGPICGPGKCNGCCRGNVCLPGNNVIACGRNGGACTDCQAIGKTCQAPGVCN